MCTSWLQFQPNKVSARYQAAHVPVCLHCLPAIQGSVGLLVEVHLRSLHADVRHCDIIIVIKQCHHSCLTDGHDELHVYCQDLVHPNHTHALNRSSQLHWHQFGDGLATSLLCFGRSSDLQPVVCFVCTEEGGMRDRISSWAVIDNNTLTEVFSMLPFNVKLDCESVCVTWRQALRHRPAAGVWGRSIVLTDIQQRSGRKTSFCILGPCPCCLAASRADHSCKQLAEATSIRVSFSRFWTSFPRSSASRPSEGGLLLPVGECPRSGT